MRLPSQTLALVKEAARQDGRTTSAMFVRLMQIGLATMVADGRLAV